MTYDVIIIGAGIVGCACAREFALAGRRVAIIERDLPNRATTAAGMGHVVVLDDSPAQLALSRYSRSLWRELASALPSSVEYESRGTIWLAADEEELAEVHAKHATYTAADIRSVVMNAKELAVAEPKVRTGLLGALIVPEDAVILPPAAAGYFLDEAMRHGAVLRQRQPVVRAGEGVVRLSDGVELHSEVIDFTAASVTNSEAQRTSAAHRTVSGISQSPVGRTRILEECAQGCFGFGGFQYSAAEQRPIACRLVTAIRQ